MKLKFPSFKGHNEIVTKSNKNEITFIIEGKSGMIPIGDFYSLALTLFTPKQLDKIMIEKMIEVTESKRQMKVELQKDMKKGEILVVNYTQTIPNLKEK